MQITEMFLLVIFITGISSELPNHTNDPENTSPDLSRAYYRYNHPPLLDDYEESDPEEFEIRKVRAVIDNSESSITQVPLRSKKRNKTKILREKKFEETNAPIKIPVDVIYEPEPIIQRVNNTKNEVSNEEKVAIPLPVTEKVKTTSPSPSTIVPKVFTKRPPEYNPVFKKIRQRDPVVKIVEAQNYVYSHSGNFHYSFEGSDGTKVSSEGELKSFGNEKTGEAVVGNVYYKDNDGNDVSLSYTADENGYRPQGAHLPTPPPIPPAIARALAYLATATTPEPVTKPSKEKN